MKSYTDLEQSKKLTEFLPIESADMYYKYVLPESDRIFHTPEIGNPINSLKWYNEGYTFSGKRKPITLNDYCVPCWSLAALFGVIKDKCGYFEFVYLKRTSDGRANPLEDVHRLSTDLHDVYKKEAVDACYEMILKLHELNLL